MVFYLSYGKRLEDDSNDLNGVLFVLDNFVRDTYPGAHLVDTFPVLDRFPDWLAWWRVEARMKHEKEMELYQRLVLEVRKKMFDSGDNLECFAARLWDQQKEMSFDLEDIAYVAGSAFEAGTDTTAGTVQWFLMAMVLYPDTMKAAQAELDSILGTDGKIPPSFSDMQQLPYCYALVKEVFRWSPAAPGGFPHYSDNDDFYKGYKINRKTMVIPCIWSMHRSEEEYPEPHRFNPDRFLCEDKPISGESLTEGHYGFGFGRRKCPGQYLGAKTIWIGLVRLLWGFNIGPEYDEAGNPLTVDPDNCTSGMTSKPINFPLQIAPRSAEHERTIRREWDVISKGML
ncbi:uncharacterized protein FIBRA_09364 [Fibroporia radiculosa]|uniref:Cytochrome P450 n=1 Tax=Fibroporia radiculosa TaxID=599839 RepID=J7S6D2_9APHY|nr:uncharacterized protein FIBRA_09364 [Fibroporia radiculosa]CCM07044.1 predicted protein [Fibroporia radiculosa]